MNLMKKSMNLEDQVICELLKDLQLHNKVCRNIQMVEKTMQKEREKLREKRR